MISLCLHFLKHHFPQLLAVTERIYSYSYDIARNCHVFDIASPEPIISDSFDFTGNNDVFQILLFQRARSQGTSLLWKNYLRRSRDFSIRETALASIIYIDGS